jgi:uncharacterized membrane protein
LEHKYIGVWRSLVARIVRDDEVRGSNPRTPTNFRKSNPTETAYWTVLGSNPVTPSNFAAIIETISGAYSMAIKYSGDKKTASATTRLLVSAGVGLAGVYVGGTVWAWNLAPLVGWDVAVITYLSWIWLTIRRLADNETSSFALREDPSREITEFVLLFASIASLAAVALVLLSGGSNATQTVVRAGLGVFSVVLSWTLTHTIFMLRYAELYYYDSPGGVEIDGAKEPGFTDFAYLAFTMGMTFQVSDTGFKSTSFRSLALRHALLSYLFGTVIVATTINLVAGLSK